VRAARRSGRGDQDAGWRGASSSLCARVEKGSLLAHSRAARCRGKEWQRPFPGPSLRRCIACKVHGPDHWARIMGQNHGPESSASVPGENPAPAARHQIHRPDLRDQNPSARSVDKTHLRCRWSIVSMPSRATPLPARDSHATWLCCCKLAFNAAVLTRCLKRRRQPQRQGGIHRLSEARAQSA